MSTFKKRRGITLIELLVVIAFLALVFFLLSRPSARAVEIVGTVTGERRYDEIVAAAAFLLTLFVWICIIVGIYHRLNINGVAMTNLCRWRGIHVPALEPVIPETLLLNENTP